MEHLGTVKRDSPGYGDVCIICEAYTKEVLVKNSDKGRTTLQDSARVRHKVKDVENRLTIDRILSADVSSLKWHRSCYSWFTNKSHVKRLEKSWHLKKGRNPLQVTPLLLQLVD